jgi:hypothetical protein
MPERDGPTLTLHVPTAGETVVVEAGYRAVAEQRFDQLVPLAGMVDLGGPVTGSVRLVNGYDSWSYAGVRAADEVGASWWNTAFVRPGGVTLAMQALEAARFATSIASQPTGDRLLVEAACGATPFLRPVDGSWGYEVHTPPGLGLRVPEGVEERSPPVAVAAGPDPFPAV